MNVLAIDTSTRFASVGVHNSDGTRSQRSWRSNQNHGRELMSAVVESLEEVGLTPGDLTNIAVALGPGGFSAVRVGISAALGIAVSAQLPVLGVPTHDIELEPHSDLLDSGHFVYSLLPAGRNEISWARHDGNPASMSGVASPEDLAAQIEPNALVCGESCDLMSGHIDQSLFRGHEAPTRNPNSLLDIALRAFERGESTPYEEIRPIYARPPSISKPKIAK